LCINELFGLARRTPYEILAKAGANIGFNPQTPRARKQILEVFLPLVLARLKELHERQGQDQRGGKSHNGYRKEYNGLKIPEIVEKSRGEGRKEAGVYFRTVECEEKGKKDGRCEPHGKSGHEAFSIGKIGSLLELEIPEGLINAKAGYDPIKEAVKNIGVQVKKGKDQEITDEDS
jgi:hypothetical protein